MPVMEIRGRVEGALPPTTGLPLPPATTAPRGVGKPFARADWPLAGSLDEARPLGPQGALGPKQQRSVTAGVQTS